MTTITLPWPPSVNHYYVTGYRGARIVGKRGKAYATEVALLIRTSGAKRLRGDVRLRVDMHPPDRRKRDIDNPLKCLLDAMSGGLYEDDSQIVELIARKLPGEGKPGRVVVTVEAM